jgi:hypothetical protein
MERHRPGRQAFERPQAHAPFIHFVCSRSAAHKAASIDARAAGPDDHVRMGGDLLVSVRRADRHEFGTGSIHGHENGIVEQHQGDRIAVLNG